MNSKLFLQIAILFFLITIFCSSCSKSKSDGTEVTRDDSTQNNNSVKYGFSTPVSVSQLPVDYTSQRGYVTPNHIYRRQITTSGIYFYKDNTSLYIDFPEVASFNTNRQISENSGPFCIDKNDKFIYAIFLTNAGYYCLYKCEISSTATATQLTRNVPAPVGSIMKILDNGDIVLSSSKDNGSIQILKNGATIFTTLAANLGTTPSAIDVNNSEIYFTLNLANGSVQKISSSGNVSAIIDNLTNPSDLVFDNNSNMVVETKVTLDGADYGKYTIYTNGGSKIAEIKDAQNELILSTFSTVALAPPYIDSYNNFYFFHSGYIASATINHSNPQSKGDSDAGYLWIYKMQLIKQ